VNEGQIVDMVGEKGSEEKNGGNNWNTGYGLVHSAAKVKYNKV
jgi:hypothetical protein